MIVLGKDSEDKGNQLEELTRRIMAEMKLYEYHAQPNGRRG
jgi:hypothetical protein